MSMKPKSDLEMAKGVPSRHKKMHLEIKFECEKCDKVYTRKDILQKHELICGTDIVKVVEAPVTINCETCGKSFTKKIYLEQHKRTHIFAIFAPSVRMTFLVSLWSVMMGSRWRHTR